MCKKKDYNVEVFFKREQKPAYNWVLSACGASYAEAQAVDILAGMTHREVTGANYDEPIGYDMAMVAWTDMKGKRKTKEFTGFTAEILQHEIDHCNGVLI